MAIVDPEVLAAAWRAEYVPSDMNCSHIVECAYATGYRRGQRDALAGKDPAELEGLVEAAKGVLADHDERQELYGESGKLAEFSVYKENQPARLRVMADLRSALAAFEGES